VVPSKLYGIAAAGRPVIAIAAPHGEVARLVREYACGIVVAPGDADTLARELRELSENLARVAQMGQRARAMLEASFTRRHAFARWRELLDTIA
jgi:glycosyltransferase involved in cell wall biosynthesis